ncbi:hypothetical protein DSECCO2_155590 [anaerobic digester metagenome]
MVVDGVGLASIVITSPDLTLSGFKSAVSGGVSANAAPDAARAKNRVAIRNNFLFFAYLLLRRETPTKTTKIRKVVKLKASPVFCIGTVLGSPSRPLTPEEVAALTGCRIGLDGTK